MDCVGDIYVSPDRTLVAVVVFYDQRELHILESHSDVFLFKLASPLPEPPAR